MYCIVTYKNRTDTVCFLLLYFITCGKLQPENNSQTDCKVCKKAQRLFTVWWPHFFIIFLLKLKFILSFQQGGGGLFWLPGKLLQNYLRLAIGIVGSRKGNLHS